MEAMALLPNLWLCKLVARAHQVVLVVCIGSLYIIDVIPGYHLRRFEQCGLSQLSVKRV